MAARETKRRIGRGGYRQGAGRKPAFEESADRTIRFEARELAAVDRYAANNDMTAPEVIRVAVREFLGRRSRRNP